MAEVGGLNSIFAFRDEAGDLNIPLGISVSECYPSS